MKTERNQAVTLTSLLAMKIDLDKLGDLQLLIEEIKKDQQIGPWFTEGLRTRAWVRAPQPAPSILELVLGDIIIPATTSGFADKDKFKLKQDGGICSFLGDNFQEWFPKDDGKVEEPFAGSTLRCHKLLKPATNMPQKVGEPAILPELGGEAKAESTLSEMYLLMEKQKNQESGPLLTNGWANIFYIRDLTGVLRTVSVLWSVDGWGVGALSVGGSRRWSDGSQVFSRNS